MKEQPLDHLAPQKNREVTTEKSFFSPSEKKKNKKTKNTPQLESEPFFIRPKKQKNLSQQNSTNIAEAKGGFQDFLAQSHLHAELSPEEVEAFMERTLEEMQVALGSPGGFPWYGSGEVGKNVLGNNVMVGCLGFFGGEVAVPGICIRSFGKQRNQAKGYPTYRLIRNFAPKKGNVFCLPGVFFSNLVFADFRGKKMMFQKGSKKKETLA